MRSLIFEIKAMIGVELAKKKWDANAESAPGKSPPLPRMLLLSIQLLSKKIIVEILRGTLFPRNY